MFIKDNPKFESLQKVHASIKSWEQISGERTHIFKTIPATNYRRYKCALHIGCTFTFYFGEDGKKNNDDAIPKIYCKKYNLLHCGTKRPEFAADGRAWKESVQDSLKNSVQIASETKQKAPVPKDVMKTANNILNMNVSYMQSYRALIEKKKINFRS